MAKVKGLKKLNKAVSAQLAPFGISKAVCTDEFAYYFSDNKVTFSLVEGTFGDKCLTDFFKTRFDYDCKYPFVLFLLHEVGHHKANDNIQDDIFHFCMKEKERIENELAETDDEELAKKLHNQYFNLPDEIMATQWAINYAKKHPKKVRKMWKKCEKAFHNFYEKNLDIEELM